MERTGLRIRHSREVRAQGGGDAPGGVPLTGEALAEQLVASGAASPRDDIADVAPYSEEPKLLQAGEDLAGSVYVPTGDGSEQLAQAIASATELIITGEAAGAQAYEAFVTNATDLPGPNLG